MYLNDEKINQLMKDKVCSIGQISQLVKIEKTLQNNLAPADYEYLIPDLELVINDSPYPVDALRKLCEIIENKNKLDILTHPTTVRLLILFKYAKEDKYLDYFVKCKADDDLMFNMLEIITKVHDEKLMKEMLEFCASPKVTKSAYKKILANNEAIKYISPEFNEGQVILTSRLYNDGFLTKELLDKIKSIKPTSDNINLAAFNYLDDAMFINAINENMNLEYLLNNLPPKTLSEVIFYKMNGYDNIDAYIKKDYCNLETLPTLIKEFIDEKVPTEKIEKFLDKYNKKLKDYSPNSYKLMVKLHNNFAFFNSNSILRFPDECVIKIKNLIDSLPESQKTKLYEVRDFAMIGPILLYCEEKKDNELINLFLTTARNGTVYRNLLELLEKKDVDIKKIFFDRRDDVFNDYDFEYEFNSNQKNRLIYILENTNLTTEDLTIIRDNEIDSLKMEEIAYILDEGYDLSMFEDKIHQLSINDIKSIKHLFSMGLKITEDIEK